MHVRCHRTNHTDLPEALRQRVDNSRRPPHANDIICLVKKYISDDGLAQEPLLVMPDSLACNFSIVPQGGCRAAVLMHWCDDASQHHNPLADGSTLQ